MLQYCNPTTAATPTTILNQPLDTVIQTMGSLCNVWDDSWCYYAGMSLRTNQGQREKAGAIMLECHWGCQGQRVIAGANTLWKCGVLYTCIWEGYLQALGVMLSRFNCCQDCITIGQVIISFNLHMSIIMYENPIDYGSVTQTKCSNSCIWWILISKLDLNAIHEVQIFIINCTGNIYDDSDLVWSISFIWMTQHI